MKKAKRQLNGYTSTENNRHVYLLVGIYLKLLEQICNLICEIKFKTASKLQML